MTDRWFRKFFWWAAYAINPFAWMVRGRYVLPFHRCSGCHRWFSTRRRIYTDFCSKVCADRVLFPDGYVEFTEFWPTDGTGPVHFFKDVMSENFANPSKDRTRG